MHSEWESLAKVNSDAGSIQISRYQIDFFFYYSLSRCLHNFPLQSSSFARLWRSQGEWAKEEDEETFELSTRLFLFTVESWMLDSWCVLAALHFCRSIDISGDRIEISQCIFDFSARDNFWDAILKTNYSHFLLFFGVHRSCDFRVCHRRTFFSSLVVQSDTLNSISRRGGEAESERRRSPFSLFCEITLNSVWHSVASSSCHRSRYGNSISLVLDFFF